MLHFIFEDRFKATSVRIIIARRLYNNNNNNVVHFVFDVTAFNLSTLSKALSKNNEYHSLFHTEMALFLAIDVP